MTDPFKELKQSIMWPDSEIESISLKYENIEVQFKDGSGQNKTLICESFIGNSIPGFWDEIIIADIAIREHDEFIDLCLSNIQKSYGENIPESGNHDRNKQIFYLLQITLIDNLKIQIVASNFKIGKESLA